MTHPQTQQMAAERRLIVNGDDFGRTPGINRGIIRAHEEGIVTSASLMVRWPAAQDAAAYCRSRASLSLGVHIDLGEWAYRDGSWYAVYQVTDTSDAVAVRDEVGAQLEAFHELVGRKPTHLDSHQHVHLQEPARTIVLEVAERLGVPTRACTPGIAYCGDFYGQSGTGEPWPQGITVAALVRIIEDLAPGTTELGCHPGEDDDFDSVYRVERSQELRVLCHPDVRSALDRAEVQLAHFG
jgi:predicted glycoside hydrolase/deacetylase ChbG (UPF0249 family)